MRRTAFNYHEYPTAGKVVIAATKQLTYQHDLALAYSPGVATLCGEIVKDPNNAFKCTSLGNPVAVITNGTEVLGIGPLAAKPVMEGKGVLFKKFASIDVFELEINEKHDLNKLYDIIVSLKPTFDGINLADIRAPDCLCVERKLQERMKIPVFHDDQHGTALCVVQPSSTGSRLQAKTQEKSHSSPRAPACLGLLLKLGIPHENIFVTDLVGVV